MLKGQKLNIRQRIVLITMDVLLLSELTFCVYHGSKYGDAMTAAFLKAYIPMCLVTVVAGRYLIKKFRNNEDVELVEKEA